MGALSFEILRERLRVVKVRLSRFQSVVEQLGEFRRGMLAKYLERVSHMHMADTLKVFRKHASPEFAKLLDDGLKTTESHLNHAKALAKNLERERAHDDARDRSVSSRSNADRASIRRDRRARLDERDEDSAAQHRDSRFAARDHDNDDGDREQTALGLSFADQSDKGLK